MMRKSSQFNRSGFAVHPSGKGNTQYLRRLNSILAHTLIEIAHTEKKDCIGVTLLHLGVLPHYRGLRYFLGLGGCYFWFGCCINRFGSGRFYPLRIIQFLAKTQFQRLVKSQTNIPCDAIDTAAVLVDKRGLAVWVCAYTRIGANHILRKCGEILVGGSFAVTVNNRLHEKFLVSRQRCFPAMLLQYNQVTARVSPGIVREGVVR